MLIAYTEPMWDKGTRNRTPWHPKAALDWLFFQLRIVYLGYSTTQVFYGQQLHFSMTRWQGSDGDHESGKCKEFPTG